MDAIEQLGKIWKKGTVIKSNRISAVQTKRREMVTQKESQRKATPKCLNLKLLFINLAQCLISLLKATQVFKVVTSPRRYKGKTCCKLKSREDRVVEAHYSFQKLQASGHSKGWDMLKSTSLLKNLM